MNKTKRIVAEQIPEYLTKIKSIIYLELTANATRTNANETVNCGEFFEDVDIHSILNATCPTSAFAQFASLYWSRKLLV